MSPSISVGRVFGVSIRIGPSWFLVAPLFGLALFARIEPESGGGLAGAVSAGTGTVLLFGSVLVHELAHALAARRLGIGAQRIVLFLFGGYTELEVDGSHPRAEAAVSMAGPVVSASMALVFWGLGSVAPEAYAMRHVVLLLALVNGAVAMLNLLPGFPLDGGRITRSLLVIGGMPLRTACAVTSWLGVAMGSLFVVAGVVGLVAGGRVPLLAITVGALLVVLAWAGRPSPAEANGQVGPVVDHLETESTESPPRSG